MLLLGTRIHLGPFWAELIAHLWGDSRCKSQNHVKKERTYFKMYSMKKIQKLISKSTECCLLPRTLSNTVMRARESNAKGSANDLRASSLHSHTKFMEASSNLVNINEINAVSVFDLQSEYGKAKAKALGKEIDFGICNDPGPSTYCKNEQFGILSQMGNVCQSGNVSHSGNSMLHLFCLIGKRFHKWETECRTVSVQKLVR